MANDKESLRQPAPTETPRNNNALFLHLPSGERPVIVNGQEEGQLVLVRRNLRAIEESFNPTVKSEITLESVNIFDLPIDWQALTDLGRSVNRLRDVPFEQGDFMNLRPPQEATLALPMVASIVANKRNPEIPVTLPNKDEVVAMKPWLATVERFIGRFSEGLAKRFGKYVEKRGQQVVLDLGEQISHAADEIATIQNPKASFISEVTQLYMHLATPSYQTETDFFGFSEYQSQVKIEDKISDFMSALRWVKNGGKDQTYSKAQYPMLTTIAPLIKFPPDSLGDMEAGIAGAELMTGMHTFLRNQGIDGLLPPPAPREFDLFDLGTWGRGFAELFFADKLERVKRHVPDILTKAYNALPENGPQLANGIYEIAENLCVLHAQGHTPEEITSEMFAKK